jgi:hypothetical protein
MSACCTSSLVLAFDVGQLTLDGSGRRTAASYWFLRNPRDSLASINRSFSEHIIHAPATRYGSLKCERQAPHR